MNIGDENIPENLKHYVLHVGQPVTSQDMDAYKEFSNVQNTNIKYETILSVLKVDREQERSLRKQYAWWIIGILIFQVLSINSAFFLIGANVIKVEKWVASTFIVSVFVEIVAMTTIVLKYLFPKGNKEVIDLVQKL